MAIIFESIYLGRNIISLQIKAHEVYIKPLKAREPILEIKESDDEDDPKSDDQDDPKSDDQDVPKSENENDPESENEVKSLDELIED